MATGYMYIKFDKDDPLEARCLEYYSAMSGKQRKEFLLTFFRICEQRFGDPQSLDPVTVLKVLISGSIASVQSAPSSLLSPAPAYQAEKKEKRQRKKREPTQMAAGAPPDQGAVQRADPGPVNAPAPVAPAMPDPIPAVAIPATTEPAAASAGTETGGEDEFYYDGNGNPVPKAVFEQVDAMLRQYGS